MGNQQTTPLKEVIKQKTKEDILRLSNNFINQEISSENFYQLIQPETIREIIRKSPNQFEIFLGIVLYNIHEVSSKIHFDKDNQNNILNNLRILVRVIPILNEPEFEDFCGLFFWNQCLITRDPKFKNTLQGMALIHSLIRLSFLVGFTVKYPNIPWEYVHNTDQKSTNNKSEFLENRIVLLQTLLGLFGHTLYVPNQAEGYINPFLAYFISPQNEKVDLFFQSLLGITIKHKEGGIIPFSNLLSNTAFQKHSLAQLASQLAGIMMVEPGNWQLAGELVEQSMPINCLYRTLVQNINNVESLAIQDRLRFIFSNGVQIICSQDNQQQENYFSDLVDNFLTLLSNPIDLEESYFQGSTQKIGFSEELLIIFYQFSTYNEQFKEEILTNEERLKKLFKILSYYFCLTLEYQSNQSPFFVCLAIFILYSERTEFSSLMPQEVSFHFPNLKFFPIAGGNYGDLIVTLICQSLINAHMESQNSYTYNQIALLINVSTNLVNLQLQTCSKMFHLLVVLTDYNFLLQNYYHPLCLVKIMQVIDNMLAMQVRKNPNLIFELCKNSKMIHRILKINFQEEQIRAFMGDKQAQEILQARNQKFKLEMQKQNILLGQNLPFEQQEQQTISIQQRLERQKQQGEVKYLLEGWSQQDKENLINQWKNFNWLQFRRQMPTKNVQIVLKIVEKYVKDNGILVLQPEILAEMITKNPDIFKVIQFTEQNQIIEGFGNNEQVYRAIRQTLWLNIYSKNSFTPRFEQERCLFFMNLNQLQMQQQREQQGSMDVLHPSDGENESQESNHQIPDFSNQMQQQNQQQLQPQQPQQQLPNQQQQSLENQNSQNQNDDECGSEEQEEEEEEGKQNDENNKNAQIQQREPSENHPNNLYIISEADSRQEKTMMAQRFNKPNVKTHQLQEDEDKLRPNFSSRPQYQGLHPNLYSAEKLEEDQEHNAINDMQKEELKMQQQILKEKQEYDNLRQQSQQKNKQESEEDEEQLQKQTSQVFTEKDEGGEENEKQNIQLNKKAVNKQQDEEENDQQQQLENEHNEEIDIDDSKNQKENQEQQLQQQEEQEDVINDSQVQDEENIEQKQQEINNDDNDANSDKIKNQNLEIEQNDENQSQDQQHNEQEEGNKEKNNENLTEENEAKEEQPDDNIHNEVFQEQQRKGSNEQKKPKRKHKRNKNK